MLKWRLVRVKVPLLSSSDSRRNHCTESNDCHFRNDGSLMLVKVKACLNYNNTQKSTCLFLYLLCIKMQETQYRIISIWCNDMILCICILLLYCINIIYIYIYINLVWDHLTLDYHVYKHTITQPRFSSDPRPSGWAVRCRCPASGCPLPMAPTVSMVSAAEMWGANGPVPVDTNELGCNYVDT